MEDLSKCFLGKWTTRDGSKAYVAEQKGNLFFGVVTITKDKRTFTVRDTWNDEGNSLSSYEFDLVQRKLPGEGL